MIKLLLLAVVPFMTEHRNVTPKTEVSTNFYGSVTGIVDRAYIEEHGVGGIDTNAVRDIIQDEITPATNRLNQTLSDSLDSHTANTNNPHGVIAAQVGAVPLVTDENGNKTSVTIGSRRIGESVGQYSLANGYNVTAYGSYSHAEGSGTTASGSYSHAEGLGTTASGICSHAEGENATASGYCSHAEGENATASGYYSHAEGSGTTASGSYSHAEGSGTTASGICSHAEGSGTAAYGYYSHVEGVNALTRVDDRCAYAWNGDEDRVIQYSSHGPGTFNINPAGGLAGFYIGEQTLYSILTNKADKADISAENPTFSNAVLTVGLNIDTNSVAVLNEIADTFGGFPIEGTATTVGGLLAALAVAIAWLKKNKVQTLKLDDGSIETSADGGAAKLDDFFTESNSLLTGRVNNLIDAKVGEVNVVLSAALDGTEVA